MVCDHRLGIRWIALLALCGWLGAGCRSPHGPNPDSTASVAVAGHTILETAHAVADVFEKAGYQTVPQPKTDDFRLVFDLPGTATDTVLYGDWAGKKVWYRAKVRLTAAGADLVIVSCDAFRVLDHGDNHFESEHKLSGLKSGRYQEFLNQVRARLK